MLQVWIIEVCFIKLIRRERNKDPGHSFGKKVQMCVCSLGILNTQLYVSVVGIQKMNETVTAPPQNQSKTIRCCLRARPYHNSYDPYYEITFIEASYHVKQFELQFTH